jgi:hypothetical protein
MLLPSFLRDGSAMRVIQGMALGAVAVTVIGFNWGGWVLGSTAQATAESASKSAVVAALAPICVRQFQQGADATAKLTELKQISSWEQTSFVEKGGWSAMPGSNATPVSGVAQACATALRDLR